MKGKWGYGFDGWAWMTYGGASSAAIRPNLLGLFFGVLAIPSPRRVVVIAYSGAFFVRLLILVRVLGWAFTYALGVFGVC